MDMPHNLKVGVSIACSAHATANRYVQLSEPRRVHVNNEHLIIRSSIRLGVRCADIGYIATANTSLKCCCCPPWKLTFASVSDTSIVAGGDAVAADHLGRQGDPD